MQLSEPILQEKQNEPLPLKEICSTCLKEITPNDRQGSFTAFLFKPSRCQCSSPSAMAIITSATVASYRIEEAGQKQATIKKPDLGVRYEVLELLGQGGMGTVWKAKDNDTGEILAIKILRSQLASDEQSVKRFNQEAEIAAQLSHPNIVKVHGHGYSVNDGSPYLVMDFVAGESLANILLANGALDCKRTISIAKQICDALSHAHARGVIHRDLKAGNIILSSTESGADQVHLVDFGIAKIQHFDVSSKEQVTQTGELFGSPAYMSPEQCIGGLVDSRSDIYSLGCVMYEILTGRCPFVADNPVQLILKQLNETPASFKKFGSSNQIQPAIEVVVMNALAKLPEDRYQSISDLVKDLDLAAQSRMPRRRKTRANKASRRAKLSVVLVAAVALIPVCIFYPLLETMLFPKHWQVLHRKALEAYTRGHPHESKLLLAEAADSMRNDKAGSSSEKADVLWNLGKFQSAENDFEGAVASLKQAAEYFEQAGVPQFQEESVRCAAVVAKYFKDGGKAAIALYEQDIKLRETVAPDPQGLASSLLELSVLCTKTDADKSMQAAQRALLLATPIKDAELMKSIYSQLYRLYKASGNLEGAAKMRKAYFKF